MIKESFRLLYSDFLTFLIFNLKLSKSLNKEIFRKEKEKMSAKSWVPSEKDFQSVRGSVVSVALSNVCNRCGGSCQRCACSLPPVPAVVVHRATVLAERVFLCAVSGSGF